MLNSFPTTPAFADTRAQLPKSGYCSSLGARKLFFSIPMQHLSYLWKGSRGQSVPSVHNQEGQLCWESLTKLFRGIQQLLSPSPMCLRQSSHIMSLASFGDRLWDCSPSLIFLPVQVFKPSLALSFALHRFYLMGLYQAKYFSAKSQIYRKQRQRGKSSVCFNPS